MTEVNQPLLSIQHDELIVRSSLADKLQQAILEICDVLTSTQMSTMLQVHTQLKMKAVFEADHEECMRFITGIDDTVDRAQMLGYYMHAYVNQSYGNDKPYSYHIQKVQDAAVELFSDVLTADQMVILRAACYLHDIIEDCRMTYNDLVNIMGREIADRVYLVTNYRGKNRKERAPLVYYIDIACDKIADALKVSDRYANMLEGFQNGGDGMYKGYVKDNGAFVKDLYREDLRRGFQRFRDSINDWEAILNKPALTLN